VCESENVSQPVRRRTTQDVRCVGTVRVPLGGPYRPTARLFRFPDGRLLWHVRLWEGDRAVPHLVAPAVLAAYARGSGLTELAVEVDRLVRNALAAARARA
jgi:hypothetical protein